MSSYLYRRDQPFLLSRKTEKKGVRSIFHRKKGSGPFSKEKRGQVHFRVHILTSSCPFKLDSRTVDQAKRPQTISKIASPSKKDDSASPILPYLRPRGLVSSNEPLFSGRRAQVSTGSSNRSVDMVDSESQPGLGRKRARRIRLWVNTAEWT